MPYFLQQNDRVQEAKDMDFFLVLSEAQVGVADETEISGALPKPIITIGKLSRVLSAEEEEGIYLERHCR